jgi:hypothetical protein
MATQWTAGTTSGQVLTAATLNTIGAAWVDYTPTLTQGVTVTKTVVQARYCQFQKTIIGQMLLNPTAGGTVGSQLLMGLPFAARTGQPMVGYGYIYDASTNTIYNCNFVPNTSGSSTIGGFYQTGNTWGASPNLAIANGDQIAIQFSYEVA